MGILTKGGPKAVRYIEHLKMHDGPIMENSSTTLSPWWAKAAYSIMDERWAQQDELLPQQY
jgi:hypothetical protein